MKKIDEKNLSKLKSDFPPGYGEFPYILVKNGYARYIQIPICRGCKYEQTYKGCVFISEKENPDHVLKREHNLGALMQVRKGSFHINKTYFPLCVVEGPEDAVYVNEQGITTENLSIPKGVVLLTGNLAILSMYDPHYYTS